VKTSLPRSLSIVLLLLLGSAGWLKGQDIHFSQFSNAPLNLNPALAGVFGGDARFVGNYRSQWRSIPVPYQTFSVSAEGKLYFQKGKYDRYLTGSLLLNSDKQGTLHLQSTQVGLPVSLTLPVGKRNFLTFGATPAFGQRRFDTDKLTFDAQWTGRFFDPGASINESQVLENTNLKYFDLSAGVNFRMQGGTKRNRLDIGYAVHHLNRPKQDFWSSSLTNPGNVRLYNKTTVYLNTLFQVSLNMDVILNGLYQHQGSYEEIVYGAGFRFHLNQKPYKELAVQIGADRRHRYNDAIIPHVEVLYRTWTLGFTYDMNINPFGADPDVKLVTNRRGGPELALIYRFHKPKPLPVFQSCPII